MTFINSELLFLFLIPILILIIGKVYARHRRIKNEPFVGSPYLMERLVTHHSKRPLQLKIGLVFIATLLSILSLAGPYQGKTVEKLPNSGRNIYIAIDLSRSMLVKDVFPDRLTKAKTSAIEIIETFSDEQICLISFAGNAWVEAPLTLDHNALKETVLSLSQDSIPYGGSSTKALFDLMSSLNKSPEVDESLLVILSDGEFHTPLIEKQIYQVARNKFRVFVLGVGTNAGDLVPDKRSDDGFFRNKDGQTVTSRIQEPNLKKIASLGNGHYFQTDDYTFIPRLSSTLDSIEAEDESTSNRITYNHTYQFFLLASVAFALLAIFAPRVYKALSKKALCIMFCIIPIQKSEASIANPKNNLGYKLYKAERYQEAAQYFEMQATKSYGKMAYKLRFSQGVAEYRAKRYPNAISSFSLSLLVKDKKIQSESHYNIGNSLFKFGQSVLKIIPKQDSRTNQLKLRKAVIQQWNDALDHYSSSLHLLPDHSRAKANFFHVSTRLEKLKREQAKSIKEKEKEEAQKQQQEGKEPGDKQQGKDAPPSEDADNYTWGELEKILEKHKNSTRKETEPPLSKEEVTAQEQLLKQEQLTKEYARRKLRHHSDIKQGYLKTGRQNYSQQPLNDW